MWGIFRYVLGGRWSHLVYSPALVNLNDNKIYPDQKKNPGDVFVFFVLFVLFFVFADLFAFIEEQC